MTSKTEHTVPVRRSVDEEVARRDLVMRVGIVVVGAMTIVVMLLTAGREHVYTEWRMHQVEHEKLMRSVEAGDAGPGATDLDVHIRQIVVPELGATDRCTSCHAGIEDPRMSGQPQPHSSHPGKYLVQHESARYGCTICHRGQGRALVFAEVKADDVHWPYALLPAGMTQSSCGLCHGAEEVREHGGEKYAAGKTLFEERSCVACHQLDGRGGSLGPALDREGAKHPQEVSMKYVSGPHTLPQWLVEHFENPARIVPDSKMNPPEMTGEQIEALTIFMLSLQDRDLPSEYLTPGKYLELHEARGVSKMDGPELFSTYCGVCHDTGTYGRWDDDYGKFIPAVRGPTFVQIATQNHITAAVLQGRPGTEMAPWAGGMTGEEVDRLVEYILSTPLPEGATLAPEVVSRAHQDDLLIEGDANKGEVLFSMQCAACHGQQGGGLLGPALANGVFQENVTDGFMFATIAYGHKDTAMPAFYAPEAGGYDIEDINALVAFVRLLGTGLEAQP
ncbi:MAG: c-type cytochrome [Deltaproteobacteria bacterium]|nr:c-type cytochrome [Deltaproteobacteria bacterium]